MKPNLFTMMWQESGTRRFRNKVSSNL